MSLTSGEPEASHSLRVAPVRGGRPGLSRRALLGGVGSSAVGLGAAGGWALSRPRGMPSLAGATAWVGSAPLTPAALDGHVVLVQFWTYTCINWIRTAPYLRAWWRAYRDDGLIILGVHTPEFSFERDLARVRRAVRAREIDYPVVVDNDHRIWNAFANNYWPALYFLDREGMEAYHVFGEGRYAESERRLQRLLGIDRALVSVSATGDEAQADWSNLRTSETYLGSGAGFGFLPDPASEVEPGRFEIPAPLPVNRWGLDGEWTIAPDKAVLNSAGGRIAFRFFSRDVHLVLRSRHDRPIPFRVTLDGEDPGDSHGVDVSAAGDGVLRDARLYQLARISGPQRERLIEIEFALSGAEAYVFTFG
jgi:thiol-disulfide isomerase/thioredoxin